MNYGNNLVGLLISFWYYIIQKSAIQDIIKKFFL